jgi:uncharacterized membrane protein YphA (DoxX/SURF4 family)
MLASIFIVQGYDTFRRPERVAAAAEPVIRPVADRVPVVPAKAEQAVRLNGAVQMVAGSLLALGRWPRLSALVIGGTLVPTTLAGHRFWEAEDERSQAQQRIHFLKNLSMFGGLLIAAADTAGKPSLAWRARHAVKSARMARAAARGTAAAAAARAARPAARAARPAARAAAGAARPVLARAVKPSGHPVRSARKEAARAAVTARRETARAAATARREAARVASSARREAARAAQAARASGKAGAAGAKVGRRTARTKGRPLIGRGRR